MKKTTYMLATLGLILTYGCEKDKILNDGNDPETDPMTEAVDPASEEALQNADFVLQ